MIPAESQKIPTESPITYKGTFEREFLFLFAQVQIWVKGEYDLKQK